MGPEWHKRGSDYLCEPACSSCPCCRRLVPCVCQAGCWPGPQKTPAWPNNPAQTGEQPTVLRHVPHCFSHTCTQWGWSIYWRQTYKSCEIINIFTSPSASRRLHEMCNVWISSRCGIAPGRAHPVSWSGRGLGTSLNTIIFASPPQDSGRFNLWNHEGFHSSHLLAWKFSS